jgi:GTP-binding protein Era
VHDTQISLIDTPGIVQPKGPEGRKRFISTSSWDAILTADVAVVTIAAGLGFVEKEHKAVVIEIARRAAARELPLILAMTKMDKVQTPRQKELYFAMRTDMESLGIPFASTCESSVKDAKGLVDLKDQLCALGRPKPWNFYRSECTDMSPPQRVTELLKQSFLEALPHEVPHVMEYRVIGWTERDSSSVEVIVEVFFPRPSYLFLFYSKVEGISSRIQHLAEMELKRRFFFVFQGFVTPGGVRSTHYAKHILERN